MDTFFRLIVLSWCIALLTMTALAAEQLQFRYSYFPSYNKIRHYLPVTPAEMTAWKLLLTRKGENTELARQSGTLPYPPGGATLDVPRLGNGEYTLTLTLTGTGEPTTLTRTFQRTVLPWEGNNLGKDPIVVPPFTPLRVNTQQRTVDCVLRTYSMSDSGFWQQVQSEGKTLLSGPMRLEVQSGGKTYVAKGQGVTFSKRAANEVDGSATWSAGPLTGRSDFQYDYDGMMKVTVQLEPMIEPVDHLALIIPLREDETWLMHPVTDLLREHYAGKIPVGQGAVWDSMKIPRYKLPAPFVPYIWLGGPERGICWFAENDKDWIIDAQNPALEVIRTVGTVALKVNLIARPGQLTRQRSITFALQATPTKPMPETPFNYRRWWSMKTATKAGVDFSLIGACYYWGAQTGAQQFKPAFSNFSLYDQFVQTRKTGTYDPVLIDNWISQFTEPKYNVADRDMYRAHVHWTFEICKNFPANGPDPAKYYYLIPYTNARGINWVEGGEDFCDEWSIYDVADPRWKVDVEGQGKKMLREKAAEYTTAPHSGEAMGVTYEIEPMDSFNDMALYYHKKMYDTWVEGIYWDNFFLQANYNLVSGGAYVGDDGKLHPGVAIFGFRDLVKRNAVMQYQMGMRPLSYIHMTNTNIVPMLSFGTIMLDWEWLDQGNYATMDMQDRMQLDADSSIVLAMSTGLQTGNISVGIDRCRPPAGSEVQREWLIRTLLAVTIVHEMKCGAEDDATGKVINILTDFGYGLPDCHVYRYWEAGQPITTSGANVKTLVLARGKKALIFIASFGLGMDCTFILKLSKLGLPATVKATNAETGAAIQSNAPGEFSLPIKKHDYQIVVVE